MAKAIRFYLSFLKFRVGRGLKDALPLQICRSSNSSGNNEEFKSDAQNIYYPLFLSIYEQLCSIGTHLLSPCLRETETEKREMNENIHKVELNHFFC